MPRYELRLLGTPRLLAGERSVKLRSLKSYALLAYLALEGPTAREQLAELLWASAHGRANLRVELHRIEQAAPGLIERDRRTAALGDAAVDVLEFEAALESESWEEAHRLYGGPFLEGVGEAGPPELEEWVLHRRTQL